MFPPFGSYASLAGRVLDASPAAYRVAVFIFVPSAGWWSKPYCDPQLTIIQPDGSWTADITTGGADAYRHQDHRLTGRHELCRTLRDGAGGACRRTSPRRQSPPRQWNVSTQRSGGSAFRAMIGG